MVGALHILHNITTSWLTPNIQLFIENNLM